MFGFGRKKESGPSCTLCGRHLHNHDHVMMMQSLAVQAGMAHTASSHENSQGYVCCGCQKVYCKACLVRRAPGNDYDGRRCPSCSGRFQFLA